MSDMKKLTSLEAIDLGNTVKISPETVFSFLKNYGSQLKGFIYTGNSKVTEQFWTSSIKNLNNIK